jgi:hypothetical protein
LSEAAASAPDDAAPAPWSLTGRGYILLLRPPPDEDGSGAPDALAAAKRSGPALMMFVDYATSGVGPYRELLYMPGRFATGNGRHWSITRIVVSTEASVRAGRANWGIPKELADFDLQPAAGGGERVTVTRGDRTLAELELDAPGIRLPGGGGLLPASLRRMVQYWHDRRYVFTPAARGPVAWTALRALSTDGEYFPELGPDRVLAALAAPDFRLTFPAAAVRST